jgi:hypothetical protein
MLVTVNKIKDNIVMGTRVKKAKRTVLGHVSFTKVAGRNGRKKNVLCKCLWLGAVLIRIDNKQRSSYSQCGTYADCILT